jgi:hypothetical protein
MDDSINVLCIKVNIPYEKASYGNRWLQVMELDFPLRDWNETELMIRDDDSSHYDYTI